MVKGSTAIAVVFVMLGATAVGMFAANNEDLILEEKEGWDTVCYDLPTDGSTPDQHIGLENIGYMNRRLKNQTNWYAEMHGIVNTVIKQDIATYKQFSNGVLISTDIATSSMVNTAKQTCYVGDSVLMRFSASDKASNWDGVNTEFSTAEPMKFSVDYFKKNYGLPATAFSVYIINEDTVLGASDVVVTDGNVATRASLTVGNVVENSDRTYTQSFVLNHETDKAPYYYRQQMLTTGGLSAWPQFSEINISYTFDDTWQVLKAEVSEAYSASMGPVNTTCTSTSTTVYEYNTDKALSDQYDRYYSQYKDMEETDSAPVSSPTAVGCLSSAFGSVLTGPATFGLDATLNGSPVKGTVYADIENMDIRAKLGDLGVWFNDNTVYLSYRDFKVKIGVDDLTAALGGLLSSGSDSGMLAGFDVDGLLEQIGAGKFEYGDGKATLDAELSLFGLNVPLHFAFFLDENNVASLDHVSTSLDLSFEKLQNILAQNGVGQSDKLDTVFGLLKSTFNLDGLNLAASLSFSDEKIAALTPSEQKEFINVMPIVNQVLDIVNDKALSLGIDATVNGSTVKGAVYVDFRTMDVRAKLGDLGVWYTQKTVYLSYRDFKVKIGVDELKTALSGVIPSGSGSKLLAGLDLGQLLKQIVSGKYTCGEGTAAYNATLSLFGLDIPLQLSLSLDEENNATFDKVSVSLNLPLEKIQQLLTNNKQNKTIDTLFKLLKNTFKFDGLNLAASVSLGDEKIAALTPSEQKEFINVMPIVNQVLDIVNNKALSLGIDATVNGSSVKGAVYIDFRTMDVRAKLGDLGVWYTQKTVYLSYRDFKVKIGVGELKTALSGVIPSGSGSKLLAGLDLGQLLKQIVSGKYTCGEGTAAYNATLSLFGLDIPLQLSLSLDEENNATFDKVSVSLNLPLEKIQQLLTNNKQNKTIDTLFKLLKNTFKFDGLNLAASVSLGNEKIAALTPSEQKEYKNLMPALNTVLDIVQKQTIAFDASLDVKLGESAIVFHLNHSALSWKNGLDVYFDGTLVADGSRHDITLRYNQDGVSLAYGAVGAALTKDDYQTLENALLALYNRIKATVDRISESESSLLPEIEKLQDLTKQLGAGADLTKLLQKVDLSKLFGSVSLAAPEKNGLFALKIGDIHVEVVDDIAESGKVRLCVNFNSDDVSVVFDAGACAAESIPQMPQQGVSYLGVNDFTEMLDTVGAAVDMLAQPALDFRVSGTVTSKDEKYKNYGGIKYDVTADMEYRSGGSFPIHLNLKKDQYNAWLSTDMYLYAGVDVSAKNPEDSSYFIELYLMDCNPDGSAADGVLDIYLSVSTLPKYNAQGEENKRDPLRIAVPATEVSKLAAMLVAATGLDQTLDIDFINQVLISQLNKVTLEQLRAVGASLMESTGLNKILAGFGLNIGAKPAAHLDGGDGEDGDDDTVALRSGFLQSVQWTQAEDSAEKTLSIVLNSEMIYQQTGLDDLTIELKKTDVEAEDGSKSSYISGLGLNNIYNAEATERTDLTLTVTRLDPETATRRTPTVGDYYDFNGISALLESILNSATHVVKDDRGDPVLGANGQTMYALNDSFYIEGQVHVGVGAIGTDVTINGLSIGIDKNDNISMDFSMSYSSFPLLINESCDFYMSMKDQMVYMKRVAKGGATECRVMPLSYFADDILEQMIFMFDFSDMIANQIRGAGSGSTGGDPNAVEDLGTTVKNILKSYSYTSKTEGDVWNLLLSVGAFTDGVINDVNIGIQSDANKNIRNLDLSTKIYGIASLTGKLTLKNPAGVWDAGTTVKTQDITVIGSQLDKAIGEAAANGWQKYVSSSNSFVITYVVGGQEVGAQTVYYDTDKKLLANVHYPDLDSFEQKAGYRLEWLKEYDDTMFDPTGVTLYAVYKPETYTVTLVSDRMIEGFEQNGAHWIKTFDYEYGSDTALPSAIESEGFFLNGFASEAGGEFFTKVPLNAGDMTLFAKWSAKAVEIRYTDADGNDILPSQNYQGGDTLRLPEVPYKLGHTGVWMTEAGVPAADGATVTGNATYYVQYTVNKTVTVTLKSDVPFEGNTGRDDVGSYVATLTLTEGTGYALTSPKASGYQSFGDWWFQGADGKWSNTANAEGLDGATLWAVWIKDVSVTVTNVYTNKWMGIAGNQYNIFGTYTGGSVYGANSQAIYEAVAGKQLTPAREVNYIVYYEDGKADTLEGGDADPITDSSFGRQKMNCGTGIVKTVTHGGAKITITFTAGGVTKSVSGEQYVTVQTYAVTWMSEEYGQLKALENLRNVRGESDMTLGSLGFPEIPPKYGYTGVWSLAPETVVNQNITVELRYVADDRTATIISDTKIDGWTKENDKYVFALDVKYDNTVTVNIEGAESVTYSVKDGNEFILPAVAARHGYIVVCDSVAVENGVMLNITYMPEERIVKLVTDTPSGEGWTKEGDVYFCEITVDFDAEFNVYNEHGTVIETFTVQDDNVFTLPDVPTKTGYLGKWQVSGEEFFTVVAVYEAIPYTVTLSSCIAVDGYTLKDGNYVLDSEIHFGERISVPVADGYTFLGWFMKNGNSWEQKETLDVIGNGTTVEALWLKNVELTVNGSRRSEGNIFNKKYYHTVQATITGGELYGAFADSVSVKTSYRFHANNQTEDDGSDHKTVTDNEILLKSAEAVDMNPDNKSKKYGHATLTLTYTCGDWSYVVTDHKTVTY